MSMSVTPISRLAVQGSQRPPYTQSQSAQPAHKTITQPVSATTNPQFASKADHLARATLLGSSDTHSASSSAPKSEPRQGKRKQTVHEEMHAQEAAIMAREALRIAEATPPKEEEAFVFSTLFDYTNAHISHEQHSDLFQKAMSNDASPIRLKATCVDPFRLTPSDFENKFRPPEPAVTRVIADKHQFDLSLLSSDKTIGMGELYPSGEKSWGEPLGTQVLGSCWLMAALQSIQRNDPEKIKSLFTHLSDGSYRVGPIWKEGKNYEIIIPKDFPQFNIPKNSLKRHDRDGDGLIEINSQLANIAFDTVFGRDNIKSKLTKTSWDILQDGYFPDIVLEALYPELQVKRTIEQVPIEKIYPRLLKSKFSILAYKTHAYALQVPTHYDLQKLYMFETLDPNEPRFKRAIPEEDLLMNGKYIFTMPIETVDWPKTALNPTPSLFGTGKKMVNGDTFYALNGITVRFNSYGACVGQFRFYKMQGRVRCLQRDGTHTEVFYENDVANGPCELSSTTSSFIGRLKNGQKSFGELKNSNGLTYTGPFKNDVKHGFGMEAMRGGSIYEGAFVNGTRHGTGKLTDPHGKKRDVNYINNVIQN